MSTFAVIDTETNWHDEVMSIGIVIASSETMKEINSLYYIIDPEYKIGGIFSTTLDIKNANIANRYVALIEIQKWLIKYKVKKLFAYNASFDKQHLPEYFSYEWYDIMKIAAYRQYNSAIPNQANCCKNGRLKSGYSVEDMLRLLSSDTSYNEVHNAVQDAKDELKIMQLLGHNIETYNIASI